MKTFSELDLIPAIQKALEEEGYQTPTPIQAQTIPPALMGRDVLGCAQTGTGKTAAFALPILNFLGSKSRKAIPEKPRVLVLAPTRELAIQIGDSFKSYGRFLGLRTAIIFGGVSQGKQVEAMERGAHILVATPGRLLDLMGQGYVSLERLEVFVLDEADRMLDMGFLPDIRKIIKQLPHKRQSLFFSATMAEKIIELAHQLLTNPVSVNVTPKKTSVERIAQKVLIVERTDRVPLLQQLLRSSDVDRAIVFTKTKHGANGLTEKLLKRGIKAAAIHGNKSQGARQRALEDFRNKQVRVLVATDVAARGIDIDGISHVINFDLPAEAESYVHRIGRTGRAGADGIAITFCAREDRAALTSIENFIGRKLPVGKYQIDADLLEPTEKRSAVPQQGRSEDRPATPRSNAKPKAHTAPRKKSVSSPLPHEAKPNVKKKVKKAVSGSSGPVPKSSGQSQQTKKAKSPSPPGRTRQRRRGPGSN